MSNFWNRKPRRRVYRVSRSRTWDRPKSVENPNLLVYIITFQDRGKTAFKIGVTGQDDVNKRLKQLQTGCPWRLQVAKVMYRPDAYAFEEQLHRRFRRWRIRSDGEWFDFGPGVDAVATIMREVPQ